MLRFQYSSAAFNRPPRCRINRVCIKDYLGETQLPRVVKSSAESDGSQSMSALRWRNIIANMSDFIGQEVGGELMPYAHDSDDCTFIADQPAVGARHHANQTLFIRMQILYIGNEIRPCCCIMTAILWIMHIVIGKHLQETSLESNIRRRDKYIHGNFPAICKSGMPPNETVESLSVETQRRAFPDLFLPVLVQ